MRISFNFSDMNYDQLGSDLLQQPLLSSQIIPDMADDDMTMVKPEVVMERTVKVSAAKIIRQNGIPIQIKSAGIEQVVPGQRVQYVKRIPTNVIQITDPKTGVKQNNAIISENVVSNSPIVINKVNGNISGTSKFSIENNFL